MKRIYSLDLLRGIAIVFVIMLHEWEDTFDFYSLKGITFSDVPGWVAFFGFFMFILGHSRSFFLFISMVIHSYILATQFEQEKTQRVKRVTLMRYTLSGLALYVFGVIHMVFLSHDGLLLRYRKTGEWDYSVFQRIYEFDTLQMIGASIVLLSWVLYGFYSVSNWEHKTWHTYFFGITGIMIFYASPMIREHALWALTRLHGHEAGGQTILWSYVLPLFWAPFQGEEAMFPYLGVTFVGAVIGIELARPMPSLTLPLNTGLAGIVLVNLGVFQLYFVDHMQFDLWFGLAPTWFILLDVGLELMFISAFFWKIDFNPNLDTKRFLNRTVFFRRWGVISLSIYMLQIIDVLPREIIGLLFGVNFYQHANLYWSLFMVVFVLIYWDILLKLWERVNFVGSWEWMIVKLNEVIMKGENARKRLHSKEVIYHSEQINFALRARNE